MPLAQSVMRCGPRTVEAATRRRLQRNAGYTAVSFPLFTPSRNFIEHSTDPKQWRSPEKEAIQRKFHRGVALGSESVRMEQQAEKERELVEQDQFTDWSMMYRFGAAAALLLLGLNLLLAYVPPNPSPQYTPYVKPPLTGNTQEKS